MSDPARQPETRILAALLQRPGEVLPEVKAARLEPRAFSSPALRAGYEAALQLDADGRTPDLPAVMAAAEHALGDGKAADALLEELADMAAEPGTAANLSYHIRQIQEFDLRRRGEGILARARDTLESLNGDPRAVEVLHALEGDLRGLRESVPTTGGRVVLRNLRDLRVAPPPPPLSLVGDGLLIRATLAMLSGPPKSFKTWLLGDLALRIAGGQPWLRFDIPEPAPVVVVSLEGGLPLIYERMDRMARALGLPDDTLSRVHLWDHRESAWPVLEEARDVEELAAACNEVNAGAILIDPIVEAHMKDENSATEMKLVTRNCRTLAEDTSAAVVLAHHTNKAAAHAGRPDPQGARGSSVLYGAVASAFAIEPKKVTATDGNELDEIRIAFRLRYASSPDDLNAYLDPDTLIIHDAGNTVHNQTKLTPEQLVAYLRDNPGEHPKDDLAEALDVSDKTLKKKADQAIEKGLPVRWEKDGRRVLVSLREVAE